MTASAWKWAVAPDGVVARYIGARPAGHRDITPPPEGGEAAHRFVPGASPAQDKWEVYAPPVAVPRSIPMHAAKIVLRHAGLLEAAEVAVQAAGGDALIAWTSAPSIARSSPTMKGVQAVLGLSEADVDALFIAATDLII